MKLSVVMPVFNERATLQEVVLKVLAVSLEIELICVDDGSQDGSREILAQLQSEHPQIRLVLQPQNMAREPRSAAAFRKPPANTSLFRTPIWSTIRRSIRG